MEERITLLESKLNDVYSYVASMSQVSTTNVNTQNVASPAKRIKKARGQKKWYGEIEDEKYKCPWCKDLKAKLSGIITHMKTCTEKSEDSSKYYN